ncbi:MAG: hypothetical protein JXB07_17855 [Anaerolineae bacterium]|nr:hypothetical protein [Anaerolineae bacterium]
MAGEQPVEVLQRFNTNLDKATNILNEISRFIKQLEDTLHMLETQKDAIRQDKALQTELSKCDTKIIGLKNAINNLVDELADTQAKIDRAQI